MKCIGLIGGMSWESTVEYYRIINEEVKIRLGGLNSANCILWSVNFEDIELYQRTNEWEKCGKILNSAAKNLEKAGADFLILCTNTMHKVSSIMLKDIKIPFLHIVEMTSEEILKNRIKKIGLLGTKYTMTEDFYIKILEKNNLNVIVPDKNDQTIINDIIYKELCNGIINKESKNKYLEIINKMVKNGIEGLILGCTEIGLLIKEKDVSVKTFDTTKIHAKKAVEYAI
jgi:aspartate racemase